jgi:hypothetical protein
MKKGIIVTLVIIVSLFSSNYIIANSSNEEGIKTLDMKTQDEATDELEQIYNWDDNYGESEDICMANEEGTIIYVAEAPGGLLIVNTTDPVNPKVIKQIDEHKEYFTVKINNNKAFVRTEDTIRIYDVTDPLNPIYINSYLCSFDIRNYYIRNELLYVAIHIDKYPLEEKIRVEIVNITLPAELESLSVYDLSYLPKEPHKVNMVIKENYLVVLANNYLEVVNTENKLSLTNMTQIEMNETCGYPNGEIVNENLYLICEKQVLIYSLVDLYNLTLIKEWDNYTSHKKLTREDDHLYVITDYSYKTDYQNVTVLNFSSLEVITSYNVTSYAFRYFAKLLKFGNYYYFQNMYNSVRIMEKDGYNWNDISRFDDGKEAMQIEIAGNFCYVLEWGKITIFNVTNPREIERIRNYSTGSFWMLVENNLLYSFSSNYTLEIYNISNVMDIQLIGTHYYGESLVNWFFVYRYDIVKDGTNLYVSMYWAEGLCGTFDTIVGIDVSNFNDISSTVIYYSYHHIQNIYVENDVMYLFDRGGMIAYNVENMNNIVNISRVEKWANFEICRYAEDIEVKYGYVFMAIPTLGFVILELDIYSVEFIGYYNTSDITLYPPYTGGKRIAVDGCQLYLVDYDEGLMAFDISDLMEPKLLAVNNDSQSIEDIETAGNLIFAAEGWDDFSVYKLASKEIIWPPEPLDPPRIRTTLNISANSIIWMLNMTIIILFAYRKKRRKRNFLNK